MAFNGSRKGCGSHQDLKDSHKMSTSRTTHDINNSYQCGLCCWSIISM